ncbi:MAG TPA: hypothetical protein H9662_06445 [Firmicutes bacterium]|nr:hypothetical protein [Bacillota bacterium]
MNTNCNIIQDLIPLVKDGVASNESRELVFQHIEKCETCKNLYDSLPDSGLQAPEPQRDAKILLAMRRTMRVIQLMILCIGGLISISIGQSSGVFYNFLLLPLLGVLSGIGPRVRWYWVPIILFAGEFLWYCLYSLWTSSSLGFFSVEAYSLLGGAAVYGTIYAVLALLGRVAVELFRYAFRR